MSVKGWKTTTAGILSATMATAGPVSAYFAIIKSPKAWQAAVPGAMTLVSSLCRAWIGVIQQDPEEKKQ